MIQINTSATVVLPLGSNKILRRKTSAPYSSKVQVVM